MVGRIPLAWLQLKYEGARFLAGIMGVAFAVTLVFMQIGFRNALFTSATRVQDHLLADLVLINPRSLFLVKMVPFTRRRLFQAQRFSGVESVSWVYARMADWRNIETLHSREIMVFGFDPMRPAFDLPTIANNPNLNRDDTVMFDAASRPEFGPVATELRQGKSVDVEINDRRIAVAGLFNLGTSFGIDGSVITSDLNFLRMFPKDDPGMIEVGLIRLVPGTDPRAVQAAIGAKMPDDVVVLTRTEYREREKSYWARSVPIGYVFDFGAVMGLIVGAVIVYQILFSDITAHLPDYAILKAIGYSELYLFSVVFQEAIILAVLGYLPGVAVAAELYRVTTNQTMLPMELRSDVMLEVLLATVVMCCMSAAIALGKVRAADPAEIF